MNKLGHKNYLVNVSCINHWYNAFLFYFVIGKAFNEYGNLHLVLIVEFVKLDFVENFYTLLVFIFIKIV